MLSLAQNFRADFDSFAQNIVDPVARRLVLLAAMGATGPQAPPLLREFKAMGVLHLLILSGSQAGAFSRSVARVFSLVIPARLGRLRRPLQSALTLLAAGLYGAATLWEPAMTRALLMEAAKRLCPRWRWQVVFGICLCAQILLFPAHLKLLGFYLSWLSCLGLLIFGETRWSSLLRVALMSVLSQCLVCGMKQQPWPPLSSMGVTVVANVLLGLAFEEVLVPLLGWATALVALTALLPGHFPLLLLGWIAAPAAGGASGAILVAVRAFMYTFAV